MADDMYAPELGQWAFSNTQWQHHPTPDYVTSGFELLAGLIKLVRPDDRDEYAILTGNYGCDPYENGVFTMNTYCWCDGMAEGHEEGCPPNFTLQDAGIVATWYKHVWRSPSINQHVARDDWRKYLRICVQSVLDNSEWFKEDAWAGQ